MSATVTKPRLLVSAMLLGLLMSAGLHAAEHEAVLDWADPVRLSLPVSGVVRDVTVRPGQTVKEGDVLLRLDVTPFNARVNEAAARRDGLVRGEAEARLDAERAQELYDRTVASDSELQQALIAAEQADSALRQARSQLSLQVWERDNATLKAPFAARILDVRVARGETVVTPLQAPTLIKLARADAFLARFELDAAEAAALTLDQTVEVGVGERRISGRIDAIAAESAGNYRIAVRFSVEDEALLAGMPATVHLP